MRECSLKHTVKMKLQVLHHHLKCLWVGIFPIDKDFHKAEMSSFIMYCIFEVCVLQYFKRPLHYLQIRVIHFIRIFIRGHPLITSHEFHDCFTPPLSLSQVVTFFAILHQEIIKLKQQNCDVIKFRIPLSPCQHCHTSSTPLPPLMCDIIYGCLIVYKRF